MADENRHCLRHLRASSAALFATAVPFEPRQEFAGFDEILTDCGELDIRWLMRGPACSQFVFEQQDESGGIHGRRMTWCFRIQMVRKRHNMVRSHWPAHGDHDT